MGSLGWNIVIFGLLIYVFIKKSMAVKLKMKIKGTII